MIPSSCAAPSPSAICLVMEYVDGEPLSRLVAQLPALAMVKDQYPLSGGAESASALWDRISAGYPEAKADRRDGLRLDWPDKWVHVRASNTEPIVRVIAEADSTDQARSLAGEVGKWVTGSNG